MYIYNTIDRLSMYILCYNRKKGEIAPMPKQPQWQPISRLPLIATHIDGMLEAAQEQYKTMLPAKSELHVLDDYTLNRVKEVFTVQLEDLRLFNEQLARWIKGSLATQQRIEVERLVGQMKKLREQITTILALADELSKGTIRVDHVEE